MNMDDLTSRSEAAAKFLALIANASRLRILCELQKGERSVGQLEEVAGLSQTALSQHLAKLRLVGIVATRREATTIFYSIADPRTHQLLAAMYEIFCAPEAGARKRKGKA